jgi:hypothetical protein
MLTNLQKEKLHGPDMRDFHAATAFRPSAVSLAPITRPRGGGGAPGSLNSGRHPVLGTGAIGRSWPVVRSGSGMRRCEGGGGDAWASSLEGGELKTLAELALLGVSGRVKMRLDETFAFISRRELLDYHPKMGMIGRSA